MAAESHPIPPRPAASWRTALLGLAAGLLIGAAIYAYALSSRPAAEPVKAVVDPPRALEPVLVTPVDADKVAFAVVSTVADAKMTFRGEVLDLPVALEIERGVHPELVEVSASGFEARRFWVRLEKPRRLVARLARGQGSRDATPEETQIALGEIDDPHPLTEIVAEPLARRASRAHRGARAGTDPVVSVAAAPPTAPSPAAATAVAPRGEPTPAGAAPSPAPAPRPSVALAAPRPAPPVPGAVRADGALARPTTVSAAKIEPARLAGKRQIGLPEEAMRAMLLQNRITTEALVKLCLSPAGAPTSVEVVKSTGFPMVDDQLRSEIGRWRYRPYLVNGEAAPVCTSVAFRYRLR